MVFCGANAHDPLRNSSKHKTGKITSIVNPTSGTANTNTRSTLSINSRTHTTGSYELVGSYRSSPSRPSVSRIKHVAWSSDT